MFHVREVTALPMNGQTSHSSRGSAKRQTATNPQTCHGVPPMVATDPTTKKNNSRNKDMRTRDDKHACCTRADQRHNLVTEPLTTQHDGLPTLRGPNRNTESLGHPRAPKIRQNTRPMADEYTYRNLSTNKIPTAPWNTRTLLKHLPQAMPQKKKNAKHKEAVTKIQGTTSASR